MNTTKKYKLTRLLVLAGISLVCIPLTVVIALKWNIPILVLTTPVLVVCLKPLIALLQNKIAKRKGEELPYCHWFDWF